MNICTRKNKVLFDGGYIKINSFNVASYHYYFTDHLGSVRVVGDSGGDVEQVNHYYPYGGLIGNLSTNPDKQKYKYNGKEYDTMHGLNTYDYGARQYDGAKIVWDRMDKYCEKYYNINPYVYCAGNPVSRIDIGGSLIIFINGFHFGDGGSSDYWENVDKKIINHFNDHSTPLYYDGSMNGGIGLLTSVINSQPSYNSIFINNRIHQGYMDGKRDAKSIFANLEANEMIRIVTHSMGAAYAKGFIKALINYIKKNPKLKKYLSKIIEYDFAPFQPEQQNAVSEITTYQYSHQNDKVAGNACEDGAIMMTTNLSDEYGHPITDFMRYIQSLPQGTYHIVNGQIKRQ